MILLFTVLVINMISFKSPFNLTISLLVTSIILSILFSFKSISLWITSIILLTFSGGMMILFSYASSLVHLSTSTQLKSVSFWFAFIVMITMSDFFSEVVFSMETFMKEFTVSLIPLLIVVILSTFMVPMMENCFNPNSPTQSSF